MRGHEQLVAASVMAVPFAARSFDLITSLDVLYFDRVQDDLALREFSRILVPGGRVVLRVPAYNWLRGIHDQKVCTGHRYTLRELRQKMKGNGFVPGIMTYVNTLLFPVALLKRLCEKWLPPQSSSDIAIDVKGLGRLLKGCLVLESRLITRWSLPFGLSIMAVGQKPPS
jgi:SAM-dependent methyltransferase